MAFSERLRQRREELSMSRADLARRLGVSPSSIGNYETGVSTPKEEVLLQLFDALGVDANYLYRDSFRAVSDSCSAEERSLLEKYRRLGLTGRQTVQTMLDAMTAWQTEMEADAAPSEERTIRIYCSPAAAGYAAPAFGEDFEMMTVTDEVPVGAEMAVRIQGDSMEPLIHDGSAVYVNHDPLQNGDVGIFCVDGEMLCKQYYKDPLGMVYLFSLNRARSEMDVCLSPGGGRSLTCFGRVMVHNQALPD